MPARSVNLALGWIDTQKHVPLSCPCSELLFGKVTCMQGHTFETRQF